MKHLIFLTLVLSSCGQEQAALTNNEAVAKTSEQVKCESPLLGQWVNQGNSSTFTVSNQDGQCAFTLSCGAFGLIFETDTNTYLLLDQSSDNGCNLPNSFLNYNGYQGRAKTVSFSIYNGQGIGSIVNEPSNIWSKNN